MDAIALLNQVSDAYSRISTLSIEATVINESGDEDENQRSEHRIRFLYAAPDRVRYEPLGSRGILTVCDGKQIHTLFRHRGPMRGPHYSGVPASSQPLPHSFRPDLPSGGNNEAFLFTCVNEQVKEAEMLPDEDGYRVVSVTYEPGRIFRISTSPIRFWIDPESFRIMRTQVAIGHRLPAHDEIDWTRHTVVVRQFRADGPIPDDAFDFTVPADAVEMPRGRGMMGGGGGGGFSRPAANGQRGIEHHKSHEWQGETLVEHSKWRIGDTTLTLERRMTFSEGDRRVEIVERTTGPKGSAETRCALDLI
jgi:outer membrane lipoprotein-sorting protein